MTETDHLKPWPKRLAMGSAVFMVGLGVTVLVGWFFHVTALVQVLPQLPPTTRNAAACLLLSGLTLLMVALKRSRWLVIVSTVIVGSVSVLTMVEYVFGVDAGIDELLGPSYITFKLSSPGRMAPVSATCFAMGSVGLLLAPMTLSSRAALLSGLNGSTIAAVGIATSMGFALGFDDAFGWGNLTRASLSTAVGLSVLGFGILALAWQVERDSAGTPRWLPLSVAIAVGTSTVGLWQAQIVAGHSPFGLLPAVLLGAGWVMGSIFGLTVYLAQRAQAQAAALRARERDLSLIVETIPGLVWCASPDGELTYVNQRILDYTGASLGDLAQAGWVNFLNPDDVQQTLTMWTISLFFKSGIVELDVQNDPRPSAGRPRTGRMPVPASAQLACGRNELCAGGRLPAAQAVSLRGGVAMWSRDSRTPRRFQLASADAAIRRST